MRTFRQAIGALALGSMVLFSSSAVAESTATPKPRTGPELRSNAFYVDQEIARLDIAMD